MRVENALRRTGGTRCVAESRGRLFIEAAPLARGAVRFEQGLIAPHLRPMTARQFARRLLAVHQDDVLEIWTQWRQLRQERQEISGEGEGAVFGFADPGGEVSHREARIQRVA